MTGLWSVLALVEKRASLRFVDFVVRSMVVAILVRDGRWPAVLLEGVVEMCAAVADCDLWGLLVDFQSGLPTSSPDRFPGLGVEAMVVALRLLFEVEVWVVLPNDVSACHGRVVDPLEGHKLSGVVVLAAAVGLSPLLPAL